jgi:carbon monoxide dehydrogenase subunit G
MASIRKEILVERPAARVWDRVRDVFHAHQRLFPGILSDVRRDGDARVVTFANGTVVRELIVTVDDDARRFVYASVGGQAKHHSSSIEVGATANGGSRVTWTTDVAPDDVLARIRPLIEQGTAIMKATLERGDDGA